MGSDWYEIASSHMVFGHYMWLIHSVWLPEDLKILSEWSLFCLEHKHKITANTQSVYLFNVEHCLVRS